MKNNRYQIKDISDEEIYEAIKESKKYLGTSFKIENNIIISDSTNYYIGKTKNYIFYYQEENKSTKVYPIKDIKEIEIIKYKATSKK